MLPYTHGGIEWNTVVDFTVNTWATSRLEHWHLKDFGATGNGWRSEDGLALCEWQLLSIVMTQGKLPIDGIATLEMLTTPRALALAENECIWLRLSCYPKSGGSPRTEFDLPCWNIIPGSFHSNFCFRDSCEWPKEAWRKHHLESRITVIITTTITIDHQLTVHSPFASLPLPKRLSD